MAIIQKKKTESAPEIDFSRLPKHIGIILDGNGRWAKKRSLPRTAGHAVAPSPTTARTSASTISRSMPFPRKTGSARTTR